ncbi:YecR family lipoprotein [Vibrio fluvialis]|uniref:YecR family lipoprotein n=1 Tax=Vibrio fluvialis TaxID=676 RepID=UPI003D7D4EB5
MKKIAIVFAFTAAVAGCVSTKMVDVEPTTINGSKADGYVTMGYMTKDDPYTIQVPNVDWELVDSIASQKCKAWNYSEAKRFGDMTRTQCTMQQYDAWAARMYCAEKLTLINYQCVD